MLVHLFQGRCLSDGDLRWQVYVHDEVGLKNLEGLSVNEEVSLLDRDFYHVGLCETLRDGGRVLECDLDFEVVGCEGDQV